MIGSMECIIHIYIIHKFCYAVFCMSTITGVYIYIYNIGFSLIAVKCVIYIGSSQSCEPGFMFN